MVAESFNFSHFKIISQFSECETQVTESQAQRCLAAVHTSLVMLRGAVCGEEVLRMILGFWLVLDRSGWN